MSKQTKLDIATLKDIAVAAAELVYHYKLIARSINRDQETLKDWRDRDEDFSHRLEEGRMRFLKKQISKARPEFLLERMEKEVFTEHKTQDITVKGRIAILGDFNATVPGDDSPPQDNKSN